MNERLARLRQVYHEYPRQFWVLVGATFIDRVGGALLFPFFTLYITRKFGVGMTEVGVLFGVFSISSFFGSMLGGALTDRAGRKVVVLFGLVMSALSAVGMGLVNDVMAFGAVAAVVGMLADVSGPAYQAMIADLLPEDKRASGFGIMRVVANLAVVIGPMVGGLLASRSYLMLFVCDAVASVITAAILYFALAETKPAVQEGAPPETMGQTLAGYRHVLRNPAYVWFLLASALMVLVYMQMNTTLSVYLRDTHGVAEQAYGYILSLNAAMVVLFQFPIARWMGKFRPLWVMAAGTLLYAAGFAMYGFVSLYWLFLLAMAIITVGEMLTVPVSQAVVAGLAPEEMRGRYMAVYGLSWLIPVAVGPLMAGMVMDNLDPRWVWYAAGVLGSAAAALFLLLQRWLGRSSWEVVDRRLRVLEMLEERQISASEAAERLNTIQPAIWSSLASDPSAKGVADRQDASLGRRHVRFRVSDLGTGIIKCDLRIPAGLVDTVLQSGGRLAEGLEGVDLDQLRALLRDGANGISNVVGDEHIEMTIE